MVEWLGEQRKRESHALTVRRPSRPRLLELGEAVFDFVRAMDRMFRSMGIPTAFSYAEEHDLRVETVEIACPSCHETLQVDEELAEDYRYCSRCGSEIGKDHAPSSD